MGQKALKQNQSTHLDPVSNLFRSQVNKEFLSHSLSIPHFISFYLLPLGTRGFTVEGQSLLQTPQVMPHFCSHVPCSLGRTDLTPNRFEESIVRCVCNKAHAYAPDTPKISSEKHPCLPTVRSDCQRKADFLRWFVPDLPIPTGGLGCLILLPALERRTVCFVNRLRIPTVHPAHKAVRSRGFGSRILTLLLPFQAKTVPLSVKWGNPCDIGEC